MWHRLYYHVAWTTLDRAPIIDAAGAQYLSSFLRAVASQHRARVLELGAVRTHVHLLLTTHPMTELSRLIGHFKGGSATLWNKRHATEAGWFLRWAPGYSIASVSWRQLGAVRAYLRAQPDHHPEERIAGWGGDRPSLELRAQEFPSPLREAP